MNARLHSAARGHYATFIHEAGHAVAALVLGMHVTQVFVDLAPRDAGVEVVGQAQSTGVNTPTLARLVGNVAGEIAERRWYARGGHPQAVELAHTRAHVDHAVARGLTAGTSLPSCVGHAV